MPIAILRADILFPGARSLKEKRSPLNSLKGKLRSRFGASVAEVDHQELHGRATVEVAIAARDGATAESMLDKAIEYIRRGPKTELIEIARDLVDPDEPAGEWQ